MALPVSEKQRATLAALRERALTNDEIAKLVGARRHAIVMMMQSLRLRGLVSYTVAATQGKKGPGRYGLTKAGEKLLDELAGAAP